MYSTPMEVIALNLDPVVAGCGCAVRRFPAAGTGGAIVNVCSHQAQRAVRGALPYATAKAATEGLTRALAVDYGPKGIRTHTVALGSATSPLGRMGVGRERVSVSIDGQSRHDGKEHQDGHQGAR